MDLCSRGTADRRRRRTSIRGSHQTMSDLEHCCFLIGDQESSGNCVRLANMVRAFALGTRCLAPSCPKPANMTACCFWRCALRRIWSVFSVERDEISPKADTLRSEEHIASANRKSAKHRVLRVLSFFVICKRHLCSGVVLALRAGGALTFCFFCFFCFE